MTDNEAEALLVSRAYDAIPYTGPIRALEHSWGTFPTTPGGEGVTYRWVRRVPDEHLEAYAAALVQIAGIGEWFDASDKHYIWRSTRQAGTGFYEWHDVYRVVTLTDAAPVTCSREEEAAQ